MPAVSFLTGEGSGLAMTEAYVLARELERANGNIEMVLADYEKELRSLVEGPQ